MKRVSFDNRNFVEKLLVWKVRVAFARNLTTHETTSWNNSEHKTFDDGNLGHSILPERLKPGRRNQANSNQIRHFLAKSD